MTDDWIGLIVIAAIVVLVVCLFSIPEQPRSSTEPYRKLRFGCQATAPVGSR